MYYLWIPMLAGAVLVFVLVGLTGFVGVPCRAVMNGTARLWHWKLFWTSRFYASGAWTFNDSWATNIAALGTAIGVLLVAGGTLQSVFRGLDLNPFVIMNVACGGIVASAPLLFGIVNVVCVRRYPRAPADASVTLTQDATMVVPDGASIAVPGGATTETAGGKQKALVKAGGTIPAPPGSKITVRCGGVMGLPSGAAVPVRRGGTVIISDPTWITANDRPAASTVDRQVNAEAPITVTGGATITIIGAADMTLRKDTKITAPGQRDRILKSDTAILLVSDSNVLAADMRSLLPAAALTTFGIGTEIGLVAVLAIHFSGAVSIGRVAAWVISATVAAGLVVYGATAIRALADSAPGSSLSAGSGTSFTL